MNIKSERFLITDMTMEMCGDIHKNSLDEDNRRFLPDEVYETVEKAEEAVKWVIKSYQSPTGPFVYPIIKKDDTNKCGFKLIYQGVGKYQEKERELRRYIFEC